MTRMLASAASSPLTVARHFDGRVLAHLRETCRIHPCDAGYYDHLSMLEYARRLPLPVIHDADNIEHELVRRYASTLSAGPRRRLAEREWRLVKACERARYAACDLIFAVSDHDARIIRDLAGPGVDIRTLPIAVDARGVVPVGPRPASPSLLYVGGVGVGVGVDEFCLPQGLQS